METDAEASGIKIMAVWMRDPRCAETCTSKHTVFRFLSVVLETNWPPKPTGHRLLPLPPPPCSDPRSSAMCVTLLNANLGRSNYLCRRSATPQALERNVEPLPNLSRAHFAACRIHESEQVMPPTLSSRTRRVVWSKF